MANQRNSDARIFGKNGNHIACILSKIDEDRRRNHYRQYELRDHTDRPVIVMSLRTRIWTSIAAAAYSRVVTVAYNIVLVPVLLWAWGIHVYGEWIILTAFATFASLSNVGFVQASASEIVLRVAAGDREGAARVLATTTVSLGALVIAALTVSAGLLIAFDPCGFLGVSVITPANAKIIIMLALSSVTLAFFVTPLSAALGAVMGAGLSSAVSACVKTCEILLVVIVALAGGRPILVAAIMVVSVMVNIAIHSILIRKLLAWLRVKKPLFDTGTFRKLLRPSSAQFLLYASVNIIAIQLPRIVLGHIAGAPAVAFFSVAVTYSRATRAITGFAAQSLQVELSRAFAECRSALVAKLVEAVCQLSFWLTLLISILLLIGAKPLFAIWTHGRVPADIPLIALLAVGTIVGSFSDAFAFLLVGINRVWRLAVSHAVASVTGVVFGALMFPVFGMAAMAAGLGLPEFATAAIGLGVVSKVLETKPWPLLKQSLNFPISMLRRETERLAAGLSARWREVQNR